MNKLNILIGLMGIALLSSCGSDPYKVEREIAINTPANVPYEQVIDHRNRVNWSPWEQKDPNMTKEFEGPSSGIGAIQKWSGNEEVGTGSLEIVEATVNEYIKSSLKFTEPFESNDVVEWKFKEENGVTTATWSTSGTLPKMASMFMDQTMDEMLGPDVEMGLENLKKHCESNYVPQEMEMPADSTSMDSTAMVQEVMSEE